MDSVEYGKGMVIAPKVFHALSFGYYALLMRYYYNMNLPPNMDFGMPNLQENWWQFLTVWNLVCQVLYFSTSVGFDVLDLTPRKTLRELKETIEQFRDAFFQVLMLPLSMAVFSVFWVLYAYDRELILPSAVDVVIPKWLNHCLHTNIVFFGVGELLLFQRPFQKIRSRYVIGFVIMIMYNLNLVFAYYWQGMWTYPMFARMSEAQRLIFYCCMYITYTTMYILGCMMNIGLYGDAKKKEKLSNQEWKGR